jgi:hypothetical protein
MLYTWPLSYETWALVAGTTRMAALVLLAGCLSGHAKL